ncbi:hypothetical protein I79_020430 [Cricetulus griseus]|uniref:Uncharacterized protein n=1 Tax=Cricetulus griseus TaxID=10029 RepID=G3IA15_CRIGR|nr:hypothetical protein I79_020430 [Cricetulus griseus]
MAWRLRALAALPENLGLIPSTHRELTTTCNSNSRGSKPTSGCYGTAHMVHLFSCT